MAVLTLTVPEENPEAAAGWIRDFWRKVRQTWLGTRYFCWLELQRRGAVHYHAVWLNPPPVWRSDLVAWVQTHWGHGRTQVRFKQARTGIQDELDYVLKYTNKMRSKAYQQRYDDVPAELRTFMSQRLEIPPQVVDDHLDRELYQYVPEYVDKDVFLPAYLMHTGHREHVVPPGGRCSALDWRRPRIRGRPAARARGPGRASRSPKVKP